MPRHRSRSKSPRRRYGRSPERSRSRSRSRRRHNLNDRTKDRDSDQIKRNDRYTDSRDRSRSRSRSRGRSTSDRINSAVSEEINKIVNERVKEYLEGHEFKLMVESFKMRERERMLRDIQSELEFEKVKLLAEARNKMLIELDSFGVADHSSTNCEATLIKTALSEAEVADAILLQNKLKIEIQQRKAFEAKQKEDADRLVQVLQKKQLDDELEQQRLEALHREQELLEAALLEPDAAVADGNASQISPAPAAVSRLSFGLKKRNALC